MSGGERRRVALCRLLLSSRYASWTATNHLDADRVACSSTPHYDKGRGAVTPIATSRHVGLDPSSTVGGDPLGGNYSSGSTREKPLAIGERRAPQARSRGAGMGSHAPRASQAKARHASGLEQLLAEARPARGTQEITSLRDQPGRGVVRIGSAQGYATRS